VLLLYLARNWRRGRLYGDIFFLYGIIYPVIRFFTEYQRPDAWRIGGIPTAQWVSLAAVAFFAPLLIIRHKLRRPSMVYTPGTPWEPQVAASEAAAESAAVASGAEKKDAE